MKIGEKIQRRREELNLSREDLAQAIGVNRSAIYKWETGEIEKIRPDRLPKLVSALKVEPSFFNTSVYEVYVPQKYQPAEVTIKQVEILGEIETVFGEIVRKVVNACMSLKPEGKEKLLEYANLLLLDPSYSRKIQRGKA